jgi:hypothetical protein
VKQVYKPKHKEEVQKMDADPKRKGFVVLINQLIR